jgi:hypothetical protein
MAAMLTPAPSQKPPRFFNTAGPCRPEDHYMLAPTARLPEVRRLIDEKMYFVLHAPRQVGKTTALLSLGTELTREGRSLTARLDGHPLDVSSRPLARELEAVARPSHHPLRDQPLKDGEHLSRADARVVSPIVIVDQALNARRC